MAVPSVDSTTGEHFPAYYVFNNEYHLHPDMRAGVDSPRSNFNAIIYDLKSGDSTEDLINSNFITQINNGSLHFLASERIVKDKLLATKKGQRMTLFDRRKFLLPYEMTSRLIDEMNNLRLKENSGAQLRVERISSSIQKDRFSALVYALYRIKYYEDKMSKKQQIGNYHDYIFFKRHSKRRER